MKHRTSLKDTQLRQAFEALQVDPASFDHAAHGRLAYIYLCESSIDGAVAQMKRAILAFLAHLGADPKKYHETITRAWILAVDHFMKSSMSCASYEQLVSLNPQLLDRGIMMTHYSAEVLFSPAAREAFVEPDIQSIPPPRG